MTVLPIHAGVQSPVFFTVHSHQVLSNCVHLLGKSRFGASPWDLMKWLIISGSQGVSILSFCLARSVPSLSSRSAWTNLTWGRLCVLLVLFDSCVRSRYLYPSLSHTSCWPAAGFSSFSVSYPPIR